MPEWLNEITWGETIAFIVGIVALGSLLMKVWRPIRGLYKGTEAFLMAWNGTEEVRDGSGTVIKAKVPGVIAQIEVLRDQLQNSHQNAAAPNLRDDLDTKASKKDVARVALLLSDLAEKLDQHIDISKSKDAEQEETARRVERLAAKWAADPPPGA